MEILLAALPLVVALVMLAVLQRSALQTSIVTLAVAIGIAVAVPSLRLSLNHLLVALASGISSSLTVLYILFPALLLYQLQQTKDGMNVLARGIARLCPDRDLLVLLIVLGIAPFGESVSGFGVGTVIVIPILMAMGIDTLQAAMLGLLGQVAVPWGGLAVGTAIGAQLTRLDPGVLGAYTALITAPLPFGFGLVALAMVGGRAALQRRWVSACVAGLVLVGGEWLFSQVPGIELAGALASLLSLALLATWGYILARRSPQASVNRENILPNTSGEEPHVENSSNALPLWRVVASYAFLTGTLLLSRLVLPIRDWLQTHVVLSASTIALHLPILYNPGFLVLLSAFASVPLLHISSAEVGKTIVRTWRQFAPGAVAILCFLAASQVMNASGMTTVLGSAAATLGSNYGWIAPWLGAVGGWLTGSNTGGNAMFALLQKDVSLRAHLPLNWVMGAQNGAGSIATMVSPSRIVLAATTAGLLGKESYILRKVGPAVLVAVAIIMLLLVVITSYA